MYLVVEDFIRAYVGPFASEETACAHYEACKARGESASFIDVIPDSDVPAGAFICTPDAHSVTPQ